MRFRDKDPEQVSADALRMAERKEAEGCPPCAEAYRELARDPSRRRLLGRALAGAGALTAASLLDVGGVLAGSPQAAGGKGSVMELPHHEADHLGIQLRDHASVQPLSRFLEQCGQGLSGYEALGVTLNGQTVGAALIERHGADAFVLVGKAADGTVVPGGAVHGTQAFVLRDGAVVVDKDTSARLAALHTATPQSALRSVVGAGVAHAANCSPNTCYVLAAGCGFFAGCCFVGPTPPCCPFGGAFCSQLLVCCFG